ncbi:MULTISPECIES: DNA polymerase III subunit beta [unclassified Actinomyces]|uniref:DNA polymerase III subunit beta n=1 Tax=unclassified Actinomyces TaxID=2609248 RepID=UPI001373978B|nr:MULTISPECIES: DNA polymerase III subunit beta [unclassified Actinomyces]MBW3069802.1 DNA polymerase III subunit beta [Actinomyces sp. 594]NDR54143.1 DNA polymerase III subunit beta [Actinomyces sp. 565]QHO90045.1 DNA polymerase III subunit beta [Actinomyces sp. 432]QHO92092.1 DNA polymerase III subunit beta [Actinomyces sp. 432]
MKLRVDRDVLADAVTWTARSVPARPPVPVLAGVRLEATSTSLILASFDYEVSAHCEIPADVEEEGVVLVSGRLLADIAKALPSKPVDLEVEGTKVTVTCGASRFALAAMAAEDYPALPQMPGVAGTVDAHDLAEAVSQVSIAASRDETLPLLTSVQMEVDGASLTLMATDRYRLAVREMTWQPQDPQLSTHALLKARTLSDVAKSLTSTGDVTVALTEAAESASSLIGFEAGGRRTTSLLTDGDYPPVLRLFPESTTIHATVGREELMGAVRRVSLVADRAAPIHMSFTEGNLALDAGQGDDAQASEQLVTHLEGEDIATAFNPAYLLDGLGAINQPYVRFDFTHPSKPAVLTGMSAIGGEEDTSFRYLIMPIRFGA